MEEKFNEDKKVFLITGGANGIGRALAFKLFNLGNLVAVFDIDERGLRDIKRQITETPERPFFIRKVDVSKKKQVDVGVKEVMKKFGRIDVLINNAAIVPYHKFLDYPEDLWDRTINTNLKGYFLCGQRVAREMIKIRKGKIINISSISGEFAIEGQCAYACSKGGINMLTKIMALELAKYNICVNAIAPGTIVVERNRKKFKSQSYLKEFSKRAIIGRLGYPNDLFGAVLFLSSGMSDYITGQIIYVDGGLSVKGP